MKQIVVVDDEPVIRDVLTALFESEGYAVRTAADGLAALEVVAEQPPDLVIADIIMPRLDGWGLLASLREQYPEIPIILLSATFRGQPPNGAILVAKPFDVDHLLATVGRELNRTAGAE
ncbi:MAG: response regulator [Chloroflexota bacterium]|nr:response regulator [Chloroflexia bacterium]MDQ3227924.1 response regulator [Chloroflexota bacterium]